MSGVTLNVEKVAAPPSTNSVKKSPAPSDDAPEQSPWQDIMDSFGTAAKGVAAVVRGGPSPATSANRVGEPPLAEAPTMASIEEEAATVDARYRTDTGESIRSAWIAKAGDGITYSAGFVATTVSGAADQVYQKSLVAMNLDDDNFEDEDLNPNKRAPQRMMTRTPGEARTATLGGERSSDALWFDFGEQKVQKGVSPAFVTSVVRDAMLNVLGRVTATGDGSAHSLAMPGGNDTSRKRVKFCDEATLPLVIAKCTSEPPGDEAVAAIVAKCHLLYGQQQQRRAAELEAYENSASSSAARPRNVSIRKPRKGKIDPSDKYGVDKASAGGQYGVDNLSSAPPGKGRGGAQGKPGTPVLSDAAAPTPAVCAAPARAPASDAVAAGAADHYREARKAAEAAAEEASEAAEEAAAEAAAGGGLGKVSVGVALFDLTRKRRQSPLAQAPLLLDGQGSIPAQIRAALQARATYAFLPPASLPPSFPPTLPTTPSSSRLFSPRLSPGQPLSGPRPLSGH